MEHDRFIPLGYLLKRVASPPPAWVGNAAVAAVHSLSGCVSEDLGDYIPLWQHNGWWLFDTPEAVHAAAAALGVETGGLDLFFYAAFDRQYDDKDGGWHAFEPEWGPGFTEGLVRPRAATLSGFEVVSYWLGTSPECSPLSCNGLAAELPVNALCLFDRFEDAQAALERGAFKNSEPGPYRIIAVYRVDEGDG